MQCSWKWGLWKITELNDCTKAGRLGINTHLGKEACEGKQVGIGLQTTNRVLQSGGLLLEIHTKRGSMYSAS